MFNARTAIRTLRGVDMVCCYVDTVSRQEVDLNGPPPSRVWSRGGGCRARVWARESLSLTRKICWWNVLISSNKFREVIE
jgi:hypothetical protein